MEYFTSGERLETLHLDGNASIAFFNELFRPIDMEVTDSVEMDERTKEYLSEKLPMDMLRLLMTSIFY